MRTVTLTEDELGSAIAAHAREEWGDELYDYETSEVTMQDHTCHASCAEDILNRVERARGA
jgi:hypothetical protein